MGEKSIKVHEVESNAVDQVASALNNAITLGFGVDINYTHEATITDDNGNESRGVGNSAQEAIDNARGK